MFYCAIVLATVFSPEWTGAAKWFPNQTDIVEMLKYFRIFEGDAIEETLLQVDRQNYVHMKPFHHHPVHLGFGSYFSPPTVHGFILNLLKDHLKEGNKVLDVGCGSAYLTVCMALMVGKTGRAVGIEHIPEILEFANKCVVRDNKTLLLEEKRLRLIEGDGREGVPDEAPFDVIHVGALTDEIPNKLAGQLKEGGRMVVLVVNTTNTEMPYDLWAVDRLPNSNQELPPGAEKFLFKKFKKGGFIGKHYHNEPLCSKEEQQTMPNARNKNLTIIDLVKSINSQSINSH